MVCDWTDARLLFFEGGARVRACAVRTRRCVEEDKPPENDNDVTSPKSMTILLNIEEKALYILWNNVFLEVFGDVFV